MNVGNLFGRVGRGLAAGAAILAGVGLTTLPQPAHALSPAAGVGIGLGAFAAGTALGAAANPYYNPYYYPYGSYYYMGLIITRRRQPTPTIRRRRIISLGAAGIRIIGAITPAEGATCPTQRRARRSCRRV